MPPSWNCTSSKGHCWKRKIFPIGVVEKIAAPSTLRVQLTGVGGHAGAMLMPERHDALLAGAEIALAVEQAALHQRQPGYGRHDRRISHRTGCGE